MNWLQVLIGFMVFAIDMLVYWPVFGNAELCIGLAFLGLLIILAPTQEAKLS